jgi:hypothetical protein
MQSSIEAGCVKRGQERGDPNAKPFCACSSAILRVQVSTDEWKRGIAATANGDRNVMLKTLGQHTDQMKVCLKQGAN